MVNKLVCIPHSFMIVVDDVGWWCGNDQMYKNGPSRSGIERRHTIEDYKAIVELGRALNMRIKCGFVAGEWDRTNIVAKVRNSNKHGKDWDNASRLDPSIDDVRDLINGSDKYIELALHGLMHMYWDDDGKMKFAEFFQQNAEKDELVMTPHDVIREHLDAYFEIMHQNGFTTKIESFIPPCFRYRYSKGDGLSKILSEYGIKYNSTPFFSMEYEGEKPVLACVENGIITVDRSRDLIRWYSVDAKTPDIIKTSYFGMHWPNLLNQDPKKNMETVERWIEYFKQYQENFEIFAAPDNKTASSQALYKRYIQEDFTDMRLTLDFDQVYSKEAAGLNPELYINVKNPYTPSSETAEIKLYKALGGFKVYSIKPTGNRAVIKLN